MTELASGRIAELYQLCFNLAKKLLYLPYGIPTLYVEDYPSEHFAAAEISAVSNYGPNRIFVNDSGRKSASEKASQNMSLFYFTNYGIFISMQ